ncbi:MAG TPA: UDP-N-acetylglucosamine 2-epimerase (non-hydrolyzing) [Clostridiales bacterium]|nr:UDP-N-acetylglucosamine 2-epimerase (non-hydrolyzing) [Clostridiales bacterium]HOL91669.1 UDP-N-acetylglucosamine 2-epimerase (non-hydrolyzing) [Clostridiales bacterium]HPP35638.1 UDP-N-acetylglucosamine 2-epimerase (non-hydrolyzing) [Clostridiales bacterium]
MRKLRIMPIFGTRPDAVKMAPLVKELGKCPEIEPVVCVTAQHRQMLDQVLDIFRIKPDIDLDIMLDRQTLEQVAARTLDRLSVVLERERPDMVLVHGDTSTCFISSLAAFYKKIPIGHVEAGLRTFDKYSPFPEEMNRKLTAALADLHFAPTPSNKSNLLSEGINPDKIYITGNTVIDAMQTTVREDYVFNSDEMRKIDIRGRRVIAVTAHRRENLGSPLEQICLALNDIASEYDDVCVIYAVHLNPAVRETAFRILGSNPKVHLIDPLDVQDMHNLMARSYIVMTDSGGLQEEAPALGKPVLVMRKETERPEAVEAGTVKLAGIERERIKALASQLLDDPAEYEKMAKAVNPYGDGKASQRIVKAILYEFGITNEKPAEF